MQIRYADPDYKKCLRVLHPKPLTLSGFGQLTSCMNLKELHTSVIQFLSVHLLNGHHP